MAGNDPYPRYVYDIPYSERKALCKILDTNSAWEELGGEYMKYDLGTLNRVSQAILRSRSPTDELLTLWGTKNHTIRELFGHLASMQHHQAMSVIKNLVDPKYHCLINEGEENFSRVHAIPQQPAEPHYRRSPIEESHPHHQLDKDFKGNEYNFNNQGRCPVKNAPPPEQRDVKLSNIQQYVLPPPGFNSPHSQSRRSPHNLSPDPNPLHSPHHPNTPPSVFSPPQFSPQSPRSLHSPYSPHTPFSSPSPHSPHTPQSSHSPHSPHSPIVSPHVPHSPHIPISPHTPSSAHAHHLPYASVSPRSSHTPLQPYNPHIPHSPRISPVPNQSPHSPQYQDHSPHISPDVPNPNTAQPGTPNSPHTPQSPDVLRNPHSPNFPPSPNSPHSPNQEGGARRKLSDQSTATLGETMSPAINYLELEKATDGWDKKKLLGKGGFGAVYKGVWKNTSVAVKRLEAQRAGNEEEAWKTYREQSLRELKCLNLCRHDNILPLYGYSIDDGPFDCLVYQYMQNGSLEDRLMCKQNSKPLTWGQRQSIAAGAARGIQYLHTIGEKPLVHGDIKSANILLDPYLVPKIGDFGLAREGPMEQYTHVKVSRVHGTRPYLPDEFLRGKRFSTKVDTYSFGVVLFELATGLRAYEESAQEKYLKARIESLREDQLHNFIDAKAGPDDGLTFMTIINLGKVCVSSKPKDRPEMVAVLRKLDALVNACGIAAQVEAAKVQAHVQAQAQAFAQAQVQALAGTPAPAQVQAFAPAQVQALARAPAPSQGPPWTPALGLPRTLATIQASPRALTPAQAPPQQPDTPAQNQAAHQIVLPRISIEPADQPTEQPSPNRRSPSPAPLVQEEDVGDALPLISALGIISGSDSQSSDSKQELSSDSKPELSSESKPELTTYESVDSKSK